MKKSLTVKIMNNVFNSIIIKKKSPNITKKNIKNQIKCNQSNSISNQNFFFQKSLRFLEWDLKTKNKIWVENLTVTSLCPPCVINKPAWLITKAFICRQSLGGRQANRYRNTNRNASIHFQEKNTERKRREKKKTHFSLFEWRC